MRFDVPGWLATLARCERDEVVYQGETESHGYLSVTYGYGDEAFATVDLIALPLNDAGHAAWHLFAQFEERVARAQVPANTRFVWR